MKDNYFNRHLRKSEEGYFEHLIFSISLSTWLAKTCIILFIHSIFPFLFVSKVSNNIKKINQIIQIRYNRAHKND